MIKMVDIKTFDELAEIAKELLSESKAQGADAAQVTVYSNENIATRYGEKHITQNTLRNTTEFQLQLQIGSKVGNYSGTMHRDRVKAMVNDAITLARFSPDDPEFPGFIQEQPDYPDLPARMVEYTPMEISDQVKLAIESAEINSEIVSVAGNLNYNTGRFVLMNSYGIMAQREGSTVSGIINVAASKGTGESRSSSSVAGVKFEDLQIEKTAQIVADRAYRGLNQGELDVGGYETIFGHEATMELMFHMGLATSSSMLINYQSPFKDKLGEKLFDERFTITDAVSDPEHYASQNFDTDGEPSYDITYIEDGVVKEFAYNRRNAKKLGVETNGRAVGGFTMFRSPSIKPGSKTEEELIASVDDGIYITSLWYCNFVHMPDSTITGLTRDGLFRIKNGEIVGSLKNMRFTDSMFSMYKEAEPANDVVQKLHGTYGSIFGLAGKIPTLRLGNFNFSSKGKH